MNIVRFEDKYVRQTEHNGDLYFSIEDLVAILANSVNPKDYIKKMRTRDPMLSKGWGQIVTPLVMPTAGGAQKINCANLFDSKNLKRVKK
jgi:prophage antirepressor-like protein